MAKLSASERKALPAATFGEPAKRAYPMPDKNHAAVAKGRATQQVKAGNLAPAQAKTIDAKANQVLARKNGGALSEGFTAMGSAKSTSKKRGY